MENIKNIEDIIEDFIELLRSGEAICIDTFAAAYPEYTAELLELLPLVADMETLNVSWDVDRLPELNDCDFKLLKKIGCGGMGSIYEAEQISLQRRVAVKVLSPRLLDREEQKAQFVNEAQLIAQLHHPHIVKIIDAKSSGIYCYYVMELVNGSSLDYVQLPGIEDVANVGVQAAWALDYAHNCGVLHRDIKPGNFLLDENGFLHLGDFGLSVLKSQQEHGFSDVAGGTLRYMAPEQLSGNADSVQSDIYALGATLYELAYKQPLFAANSVRELEECICCKTPVIPRKTPRGFAAILKKCLHRNPAERYPSAACIADDLQRFLNNEAVSAEQGSALYRFYLWTRRKPLTACLAVMAAIFLAAAFTALFHGIRQTGKALEKAEVNAQLADQTLEKIFSRIAKLSPSQKNNQLLAELLPYYQQIIRRGDLAEEKIYSASWIIAQSAVRCGDYKLAEKALKQIIKMRNRIAAKNIYAMTLQKQNRNQEAEQIYREVIAQGGKSAVAQDKIEVVRALLALPEPGNERAFELLEDLLASDPENPQYCLQYARLLGMTPKLYRNKKIAGVDSNAVSLLTFLAQKYPDNAEYSIELMKLLLCKLRYAQRFRIRHVDDMDSLIELSEQMLVRFPNDPDLTRHAIDLHIKYIEILRSRKNYIQGRKCFDRLLVILEVLFYNPEVSDVVRENLIELQFKRAIELKIHSGEHDLQKKIAKELQFYDGRRRQEFLEKLKKLDW